jgi:hypothetical protein
MRFPWHESVSDGSSQAATRLVTRRLSRSVSISLLSFAPYREAVADAEERRK